MIIDPEPVVNALPLSDSSVHRQDTASHALGSRLLFGRLNVILLTGPHLHQLLMLFLNFHFVFVLVILFWQILIKVSVSQFFLIILIHLIGQQRRIKVQVISGLVEFLLILVNSALNIRCSLCCVTRKQFICAYSSSLRLGFLRWSRQQSHRLRITSHFYIQII